MINYPSKHCRGLKDCLQLKPDTLDIVAKLPKAKAHADIFEWKGSQWEKKFRGQLNLLKIYEKFLTSLWWALFEVTQQQDNQGDPMKRAFFWRGQSIKMDFTVCKRPECLEEGVIMNIKK